MAWLLGGVDDIIQIVPLVSQELDHDNGWYQGQVTRAWYESCDCNVMLHKEIAQKRQNDTTEIRSLVRVSPSHHVTSVV